MKPQCLSLFKVPYFSHPFQAMLCYFGFCYFFPSLTSVCPRFLTNEHVKKCFIFPSTDGKFITYGSMLPLPCRHALPCKRFQLRAEAQLICLIRFCAQERKPCCYLLVWFLSLATDPNRTGINASHSFAKTAYLFLPPTVCQRFLCLLFLIFFVKKQNKTKTKRRRRKTLGTLEDKEGEARGNGSIWCYLNTICSPKLHI